MNNVEFKEHVSTPNAKRVILVDSAGSYINAATSSGGIAGAKSLSDATTGVQLHSNTACKYVDIFAYGGILAVGDSASVRADTSAIGAILTPGSTVYRISCSNLNEVYVSGATGTRACYVYFA